MPEAMLEALLFGHQKGAFTGAVGARAGLFEQAQHIGRLEADHARSVLERFAQGRVDPIGDADAGSRFGPIRRTRKRIELLNPVDDFLSRLHGRKLRDRASSRT